MAFNKKEYDRKYVKENKERIKERKHKYYQENGEKIRSRNRRWDKEQKEKRKEYRNKRSEIIKIWYYDNIKALCCLDCGLSFAEKIYMADFHHVNGSRKYGRGRSMLNFVTHFSYNNVVEELNKGVYLCPNCHREYHIRGALHGGR